MLGRLYSLYSLKVALVESKSGFAIRVIGTWRCVSSELDTAAS